MKERYHKYNYDFFRKEFKHGVYVFLSDTCHFCREYQKSLNSDINSDFLFLIEVVTQGERTHLYDLAKKSDLPITIFYYKNRIKKVLLGQLFELHLKEVRDFLISLGYEPLSESDKQEIVEEQKRDLMPAFYITMNGIEGCREFLKKRGIAGLCVNEIFNDIEDPKVRFEYVKSFLTRTVIYFKDPNRTGTIDTMFDYINLRSLLYCMEFSINLETHSIEELND